MNEICRVPSCNQVANVCGNFCSPHGSAWPTSPERRDIDFSSDASFEAGAAAYANRVEADENVTEDMMEE